MAVTCYTHLDKSNSGEVVQSRMEQLPAYSFEQKYFHLWVPDHCPQQRQVPSLQTLKTDTSLHIMDPEPPHQKQMHNALPVRKRRKAC